MKGIFEIRLFIFEIANPNLRFYFPIGDFNSNFIVSFLSFYYFISHQIRGCLDKPADEASKPSDPATGEAKKGDAADKEASPKAADDPQAVGDEKDKSEQGSGANKNLTNATAEGAPAGGDAEAKENGVAKENGIVDKCVPEMSIQSAAAAALASAAVKAKHLAAVEERKIKSLVALLVETQMKKLEIKLRHFEELESNMERERESEFRIGLSCGSVTNFL